MKKSNVWSSALGWVRALRNREGQFLLVLAILVGLLTGLTIVAFILLTERLGSRMYPIGGAAWRRLIVPVLGALGSGWLVSRYFPEARGSGIPQTRTALELRGGRISLRTVLGRFFLSSASLASGIALGREGPSVQLGGGIASVLGQKLGLGPARLRQLIPVGAAAAVAAAFNTPIAAVLFTLEEVVGDLHAPVLGLVVIGSVTSWAVLQSFLGDEPLFHVPVYQLVHPGELLVYAGLGVAGGLLSTVFVKSVLYMRARFMRLPKKTRPFQPVIGGVFVGLVGMWIPQVLGVGYDYVDQVLNGDIALRVVLLLIPLKVAAASLCYSSGNTGGIFGPSLFFGAVLGGAVGHFAHAALPGATGTAGAYALVGMGTTFAGIIRTPMTSVFMIFELTRDYSILVPVMISNMTSYIIAARLQRTSIYVALAEQDGIHLPGHSEGRTRRKRTVLHAMAGTPVEVAPETAIAALPSAGESGLYLVVDQGKLVGVTATDSTGAAVREGRGHMPVSTLVASAEYPHVHPDHGIELALERMGQAGLSALPVVDRADIHKVRGVITVSDALRSFRRATT